MTTLSAFRWCFLAVAVAGSRTPMSPAASATAAAAIRRPPPAIRPQRTRSRAGNTPYESPRLPGERLPQRGDPIDRSLEVVARELAAVDGVDQRLLGLGARGDALREQQQVDAGAGAPHRALARRPV